MSILDSILKQKKREVEINKKNVPLSVLEKSLFLKVRDFKSSLCRGKVSIIAEIKRKSPSAGTIRKDVDPISIAKTYEESGADAISVLTDGPFFGGCTNDLSSVRNTVSVPVLRKDFILDEYQIIESRMLGADAVLLIAKILDRRNLQSLIHTANDLGMLCLVEVRSEKDLEKGLSVGAEIVGVNNRDLDTFRIDLNVSLKLSGRIPDNTVAVSESGIRTREDVLRLEEAGFDAILVGESLMGAENIGEKVRYLKGEME